MISFENIFCDFLLIVKLYYSIFQMIHGFIIKSETDNLISNIKGNLLSHSCDEQLYVRFKSLKALVVLFPEKAAIFPVDIECEISILKKKNAFLVALLN